MKTVIREATDNCEGCIAYTQHLRCNDLFEEHDVGFCNGIIFVAEPTSIEEPCLSVRALILEEARNIEKYSLETFVKF